MWRRRARRSAAAVPPQSAQSASDPFSLVTVISGLAHELRNPLSNLKLNLQLLREDLAVLLDDQRDNPPQRRILGRLETAVAEAGRLERTLEEFLLFASNPRLDLRTAEVNSLVGELLEFFSPQAAARRVNLRATLSDQPLHARLDPVMFKQALLNLLINAQQAMEPGGELTVRTEAAGPRLRLHVVDTGPGIGPPQIDKIFLAYYSTKKGGTGLGLPISRKIVQAHGGTLTVSSDLGKGSDFCIELPLCEE
jgi:signal transduction histidine kinase